MKKTVSAEIESIVYSSTSDQTKKFCEENGFIFDINFVETSAPMRAKVTLQDFYGGSAKAQYKNVVLVRGTLGRPEEFAALSSCCGGWVGEAGKIYIDSTLDLSRVDVVDCDKITYVYDRRQD